MLISDLHSEKRIADKWLLQHARAYYDRYADSRNKPFMEIDLAAYVTSAIILKRMHYDVERMFSLFEKARLYWGREP